MRPVRPPWGPEDRELHLESRVGGPYEQFVGFAWIVAMEYEFQSFLFEFQPYH